MEPRSWMVFIRASILEAQASVLRDDMPRVREYGGQACYGLRSLIQEHLA
jgi:hypothetical protein